MGPVSRGSRFPAAESAKPADGPSQVARPDARDWDARTRPPHPSCRRRRSRAVDLPARPGGRGEVDEEFLIGFGGAGLADSFGADARSVPFDGRQIGPDGLEKHPRSSGFGAGPKDGDGGVVAAGVLAAFGQTQVPRGGGPYPGPTARRFQREHLEAARGVRRSAVGSGARPPCHRREHRRGARRRVLPPVARSASGSAAAVGRPLVEVRAQGQAFAGTQPLREVLSVAACAHERCPQRRSGNRAAAQHVRDGAARQRGSLPCGLFFQFAQGAALVLFQ